MQLLRSISAATIVLSTGLFMSVTTQAAEKTFLGGIVLGKHSERWEARLGGGAFDTGPFTSRILSGGVINGEILAPSPEFLSFLGSPRPYIGTEIAISDDPIHVIYAGFNWEAHLTQRLYLGFSGGGSWNSSKLTTTAAGAVKNLGSSLLFHLQGSIGFDFTENVTGQIYLNHFSNAGIKAPNHGLESVGARLGYRF